MKFKVLVSGTFQRQFGDLSTAEQGRVRKGLAALVEDPRRARPGAAIKQLVATAPPKHRLRVGDLRIVYAIDGKTVNVIEVFRRKKGYRD